MHRMFHAEREFPADEALDRRERSTAPKPRRSLRSCGVLTSVRSEWKNPSIACEEAAQRGVGKAALCSGLSAPPQPFI